MQFCQYLRKENEPFLHCKSLQNPETAAASNSIERCQFVKSPLKLEAKTHLLDVGHNLSHKIYPWPPFKWAQTEESQSPHL